jgi:hypothetical protein
VAKSIIVEPPRCFLDLKAAAAFTEDRRCPATMPREIPSKSYSESVWMSLASAESICARWPYTPPFASGQGFGFVAAARLAPTTLGASNWH